MNISIMLIMSKCVNFKVYTAVFLWDMAIDLTRGNTPVGVLPHDA